MMINITSPLTAEELSNRLATHEKDKEDGAAVLPIPDGIAPKTIPGAEKAELITPYRNAHKQVLFYIVRLSNKKGQKSFPWCWWRYSDGREEWKCKRPLEQEIPLLNLPNIINNSDKLIRIGEGEKCAKSIQRLFPDSIATTSCGGAYAAAKTDWSVMCGRDVILFLDYDEAGANYGRDVYQLCKQAGALSIKRYNMQVFAQYAISNGNVIKQIRVLPDKYDIANAEEEGWTAELLKKLEEMQQSGMSLASEYEPAVSIAAGVADDDWPEPLSIKAELLPVKEFSILLLPESLQEWVLDIAHRMQCPIDQITVPAIVMLSSVVGARCGIRPKRNDNWLVIPNLWGGIIGKPSTLKSPALAEIMKPLNNMEVKARANHKDELKNFDMEIEFNKIAQTALKKQMEKELTKPHGEITEEQKQAYKNFEQIEKPVCKRYKTNDASIEKMGELLSENPNGVLLFRDELVGLLVSWDKSGHEADRAFYLETWNGYGSHTTDRIGRGTTHCDNMCVSILGSTQPSKLLVYLHKATRNIENDGLMQRFQLLIFPDEIKNWQHIDIAPNKLEKERAFNLVERITDLDFSLMGAFLEEDSTIPYFHFSKEGQVVFDAWLTDLELTKLRGNEEDIIVEHLAKYRKLMPALALIFHIIDLVDRKITGQVTLQSAEKAAAWCDYLELHAKRIYGMALDKTHATSALSKKIKRRSLVDGFTAREVGRSGWSMLAYEDAQDACDELVEAGWLREKYIESSPGKGKTVYLINPKIWGNHD